MGPDFTYTTNIIQAIGTKQFYNVWIFNATVVIMVYWCVVRQVLYVNQRRVLPRGSLGVYYYLNIKARPMRKFARMKMTLEGQTRSVSQKICDCRNMYCLEVVGTCTA